MRYLVWIIMSSLLMACGVDKAEFERHLVYDNHLCQRIGFLAGETDEIESRLGDRWSWHEIPVWEHIIMHIVEPLDSLQERYANDAQKYREDMLDAAHNANGIYEREDLEALETATAHNTVVVRTWMQHESKQDSIITQQKAIYHYALDSVVERILAYPDERFPDSIKQVWAMDYRTNFLAQLPFDIDHVEEHFDFNGRTLMEANIKLNEAISNIITMRYLACKLLRQVTNNVVTYHYNLEPKDIFHAYISVDEFPQEKDSIKLVVAPFRHIVPKTSTHLFLSVNDIEIPIDSHGKAQYIFMPEAVGEDTLDIRSEIESQITGNRNGGSMQYIYQVIE